MKVSELVMMLTDQLVTSANFYYSTIYASSFMDEIEEMFSNRSLFIRQTDASPNYHTLDDMCDKYC